MSFLQYTLILFIVILINESNTSTMDIELTTESISAEVDAAIRRTEKELKRNEKQLEIDRQTLEELKRDAEQLKTDRQKLEEEKKQMQRSIQKTTDVTSLNVGGEIIMTTRKTLTRIPKSFLSMMFNGRWEHKLQTDQNENIFFDLNPILFRHLLDQLQLLDPNHLYPPLQPSLVKPFQKMISKLGLHHKLSLEKNIIHFNVDGQFITNQRTTFIQLSNSTFDTIVPSSNNTKFDDQSDVFVDYHPKLFRHLVNKLRKKPMKNIRWLTAPSYKDEISFKRMLNDFSIFRQVFYSSIDINTKWKQNGVPIAGGNGQGGQLNQLFYPHGIYVDDDDQCIYIADHHNHRIVKWKYDAKNSEVVAGGNGQGDRMDQLNGPTDVIVNKMNDFIIICDQNNRRVVRWFCRNGTNEQTIIPDIDCCGLAMDNNENLYVSDYKKNEVRRWEIGETKGTIVAGGNRERKHFSQLNTPTYMFVDEDYSVYVSERDNHRVIKWVKGAKEGIVVAGGQGQGNSLSQLSSPFGVIVDHMGSVYVADSGNNRIMRWSPGSKEGSIVVGGISHLRGLSFDRQGNLYAASYITNQIQKFDLD